MKITFTVAQLKEFNELNAEERRTVISTCDILTGLSDEAIKDYSVSAEAPQLSHAIHRSLVRRINNAAKRRERKALMEKQKQEQNAKKQQEEDNRQSAGQTGSQAERPAKSVNKLMPEQSVLNYRPAYIGKKMIHQRYMDDNMYLLNSRRLLMPFKKECKKAVEKFIYSFLSKTGYEFELLSWWREPALYEAKLILREELLKEIDRCIAEDYYM